MADATEDQRLPSPGCHESHPIGRRLPSLPVQVGELADVMDLHVLRGATRLAGVRQNPLEQLGPALTACVRGVGLRWMPSGLSGVAARRIVATSGSFPSRGTCTSRHALNPYGVTTFAASRRACFATVDRCLLANVFSSDPRMTQWSLLSQAMFAANW